ncbi:hypothetical protein GCM10009555_019280 [Acrocarpospora macrocephala]|uniref:Uncharacterized protein n=1 Tax=Acrocarpospora macrocephala TaxID=150177 RepID=A0A5M3WMP0_9ACTN|nr:hypothetical protein Amac_011830 [Acrocarpospora macrocephala]
MRRRVPFLIAMTLWIGAGAAVWGVAYVVNGVTQAGAEVVVVVDPTAGAVLPSSVRLVGTELFAWDSTVLEQVLARGDVAVIGLCAGFGAVLLYQLMLSILDGEPFRQGNSARIAGLAGAVAVAGIVGSALPGLAAAMVLDRLGLTPILRPGGNLSWWPGLVALALLGVAQTFRWSSMSATR